MKKKKEESTHQDVLEDLFFEDFLQDNLLVSNDYSLDSNGNSILTVGFEDPDNRGKKSLSGFILFTFDPAGRLSSLEVATRKGKKDWQVATTEKFIDFTARFGTDSPPPVKASKKKGTN